MTYYVGILDGEADVWGVRIPDLPGCHGGGESAEAAIADATSAARDWASFQLPRGIAIRTPRAVTDIVADPETDFRPGESAVMIPLILDRGRSVRANLSLDAGLLDAIDAAAKQAGVTRSTFMATAAKEKMGVA